MNLDLRPLSLAEILDRTFSLYLRLTPKIAETGTKGDA
jgi:hypothetical protein